MYTVELLVCPHKEKHMFICNYESLFYMTWILEQSPGVDQFMVTRGSAICVAIEFGFGEFSKWVAEFNYKNSYK